MQASHVACVLQLQPLQAGCTRICKGVLSAYVKSCWGGESLLWSDPAGTLQSFSAAPVRPLHPTPAGQVYHCWVVHLLLLLLVYVVLYC
jgi:hypothetical protein